MKIDDALCTDTFLGNLINFLPTKDDNLTLMQKFLEGPPEACNELDIPEQFTIEVTYRQLSWSIERIYIYNSNEPDV